jgi:hypothetical protein
MCIHESLNIHQMIFSELSSFGWNIALYMCYGMGIMSASEDLRVMLSLVFLYQIHKNPILDIHIIHF